MLMTNPQTVLQGSMNEREQIRHLSTATTLKPMDNIVFVSGTTTITLPPVAEAAGCAIWIEGEGTCALTIQDNNDDAGLSDITGIATAGEYVMLFSNGQKWVELMTGYS